MTVFTGCKTERIIIQTRYVVPEYKFPEPPVLPDDVEMLDYPYYRINGNFFKSLDAYYTQIDALQKEYEIDKEFYSKLGVVDEQDRK